MLSLDPNFATVSLTRGNEPLAPARSVSPLRRGDIAEFGKHRLELRIRLPRHLLQDQGLPLFPHPLNLPAINLGLIACTSLTMLMSS